MVNAYRGETELRLGDRTFTLRLTTNVIACLEKELDADGFGCIQKLIAGGATSMRAAFYACLTTRSGGMPPQYPNLTLEQMGDFMDELGGYTAKPVKEAYWLLLANAEIIDREEAEKSGLIPKIKGPKENDVPETSVPQMRLASGNAGS